MLTKQDESKRVFDYLTSKAAELWLVEGDRKPASYAKLAYDAHLSHDVTYQDAQVATSSYNFSITVRPEYTRVSSPTLHLIRETLRARHWRMGSTKFEGQDTVLVRFENLDFAAIIRDALEAPATK